MILIMAYIPRYRIVFDGSIFHVTWQCHNKDWLLASEESKEIYYNLLLKYKEKYNIKIYSYCFMSNHPHLTGKMESKEKFSAFFRVVNNLFARKYNKLNGKSGQVVMDRFKSPVINTDEDALRVMMYIDLNPIRSKMVEHPNKYNWTSYHYYAYGKDDPLIDPSPTYMGLGRTSEERQEAYRDMVDDLLRDEGYLKHNYSNTCYIGDPDWVKERYDDLMSYLKNRKTVSNPAQQLASSP